MFNMVLKHGRYTDFIRACFGTIMFNMILKRGNFYKIRKDGFGTIMFNMILKLRKYFFKIVEVLEPLCLA